MNEQAESPLEKNFDLSARDYLVHDAWTKTGMFEIVPFLKAG